MKQLSKPWHSAAIFLYFERHLNIVDIAEKLNVTRQTVASFLKSLPEWQGEAEYRKKQSSIRRKQQKRRWDEYHRSEPNLKREHELAVAELSAERYH